MTQELKDPWSLDILAAKQEALAINLFSLTLLFKKLLDYFVVPLLLDLAQILGMHTFAGIIRE